MMKRKIGLLSNVTVDMVAAKLRKKYDVYVPDGFDMWISDILNPASGLYESVPEAIIVLLDGTEFRCGYSEEQIDERFSLWKSAIERLKEAFSDIPVFVSTISFRESSIRTYSERTHWMERNFLWYDMIQGKAESYRNFYVLDIARRILHDGESQFYSNKMWYMGSMPYSKQGIAAVTEEINNALSAAFEGRKKAIVLDLDNTLWGGVIGEDGVDGISLSEHKEGERFYDFQYRLLEMQKRGVLLTVNSKNNQEDAVEAIDKHPSMLLRSECFAAQKINWNDKASNIKELETEMNLTEGSFVFVDDNPVEREIVAGQCPEVLIADFPEDSSELIVLAEKLYCEQFRALALTDEDRQKTKMYQTEAKRKAMQSSSLDLNEYVRLLEMKTDIHLVKPEEMERVHQLCNKTNQFNLTTKRYSLKELTDMLEDTKTDIYTVSASDKFGDNGLIGVLICKLENDNVSVDTFLMSCRVMGRLLENVLMYCIARKYKYKAKQITGEYIPTKKNAPVAEKYKELGFTLIDEKDGCKRYVLDLSRPYPQVECYNEICFESEII